MKNKRDVLSLYSGFIGIMFLWITGVLWMIRLDIYYPFMRIRYILPCLIIGVAGLIISFIMLLSNDN